MTYNIIVTWHFITQTLRTKYEQTQVYDESSFPQGLEPNPKSKTKIQDQVGRSPQKSKAKIGQDQVGRSPQKSNPKIQDQVGRSPQKSNAKIQDQVGRSPQKSNAKKKPLGISHFLTKR